VGARRGIDRLHQNSLPLLNQVRLPLRANIVIGPGPLFITTPIFARLTSCRFAVTTEP